MQNDIPPEEQVVVLDNTQSDPEVSGNIFVKLRGKWRSWSRNERFAILSVLFLVFAVAAIGIFYITRPSSNPSIQINKKPAPTTVPSPLTGVQVPPDLAKRPVTGIMIENSVFARPQSGLQDAGVVYEAIAEGGITRFLALFQETSPKYIGPVRSLRPYYIDFAAPFQASIVHVGGSPDALKEVRNGKFRDLDEFFNAGYFYRIGSRPAPHNVYTGFKLLDRLNKSKGYKTSLFTSWPRKDDAKLAVPTASRINFAISGPDFYVHYDYNRASNTYYRSEGGARHLDIVSSSSGKTVRLHPKVVIALVMAFHIASDGKHGVYKDTGSGKIYVFQDGGLSVGTWEKVGTTSQIIFKDSKGAPLKLDAGQTWITLVGASSQVKYSR